MQLINSSTTMKRLVRVIMLSTCFPSIAIAQSAAPYIDDAVAVCSAWLMKPDTFAKTWADRGFTPGPGAKIRKTWQSLSLQKDTGTMTTTEVTYPDAKSRTCQLSVASALSLKDVEDLLGKLAADAEFGAFTGEMGEQTIGSDRKMVLGTFKRPGSNPFVGASVNSFNDFTNIIFFRTDFDKGN
jgi:hypothetical protein